MNTLLAQYKQGKAMLLDSATTGSQMPPRVSIANNMFALVDPSGATIAVPHLPDGPALDIVFVDRNEHTSKLYWGKQFNPNEITPPLCFSDNGVAPSASATEPQSFKCADCPHNVIGSAVSTISGAKIKACQDLKKFAVVVKGFPGVYQFQIKPGSFKSWNGYCTHLRMQKLPDGGKPDLSDVVTRVRFTGQGILSFEPVALVDDTTARQVIDVWERNKVSDITGLMVGRFDVPSSPALVKPAVSVAEQLPQPGRQPKQAAVQSVPPPPQPHSFQQQAAPFPPPAMGAQQAEEPKRRGRPRKEPEAPVQAAGIATPQAAPADMTQRLNALFSLPPKQA